MGNSKQSKFSKQKNKGLDLAKQKNQNSASLSKEESSSLTNSNLTNKNEVKQASKLDAQNKSLQDSVKTSLDNAQSTNLSANKDAHLEKASKTHDTDTEQTVSAETSSKNNEDSITQTNTEESVISNNETSSTTMTDKENKTSPSTSSDSLNKNKSEETVPTSTLSSTTIKEESVLVSTQLDSAKTSNKTDKQSDLVSTNTNLMQDSTNAHQSAINTDNAQIKTNSTQGSSIEVSISYKNLEPTPSLKVATTSVPQSTEEQKTKDNSSATLDKASQDKAKLDNSTLHKSSDNSLKSSSEPSTDQNNKKSTDKLSTSILSASYSFSTPKLKAINPQVLEIEQKSTSHTDAKSSESTQSAKDTQSSTDTQSSNMMSTNSASTIDTSTSSNTSSTSDSTTIAKDSDNNEALNKSTTFNNSKELNATTTIDATDAIDAIDAIDDSDAKDTSATTASSKTSENNNKSVEVNIMLDDDAPHLQIDESIVDDSLAKNTTPSATSPLEQNQNNNSANSNTTTDLSLKTDTVPDFANIFDTKISIEQENSKNPKNLENQKQAPLNSSEDTDHSSELNSSIMSNATLATGGHTAIIGLESRTVKRVHDQNTKINSLSDNDRERIDAIRKLNKKKTLPIDQGEQSLSNDTTKKKSFTEKLKSALLKQDQKKGAVTARERLSVALDSDYNDALKDEARLIQKELANKENQSEASLASVQLNLGSPATTTGAFVTPYPSVDGNNVMLSSNNINPNLDVLNNKVSSSQLTETNSVENSLEHQDVSQNIADPTIQAEPQLYPGTYAQNLARGVNTSLDSFVPTRPDSPKKLSDPVEEEFDGIVSTTVPRHDSITQHSATSFPKYDEVNGLIKTNEQNSLANSSLSTEQSSTLAKSEVAPMFIREGEQEATPYVCGAFTRRVEPDELTSNNNQYLYDTKPTISEEESRLQVALEQNQQNPYEPLAIEESDDEEEKPLYPGVYATTLVKRQKAQAKAKAHAQAQAQTQIQPNASTTATINNQDLNINNQNTLEDVELSNNALKSNFNEENLTIEVHHADNIANLQTQPQLRDPSELSASMPQNHTGVAVFGSKQENFEPLDANARSFSNNSFATHANDLEPLTVASQKLSHNIETLEPLNSINPVDTLYSEQETVLASDENQTTLNETTNSSSSDTNLNFAQTLQQNLEQNNFVGNPTETTTNPDNPNNADTADKSPIPAGMEDGVLLRSSMIEGQVFVNGQAVSSNQINADDPNITYEDAWTNTNKQNSPPSSNNTIEEDEDDGPIYAVGPKPVNAKVEAKLKAAKDKLNARHQNNTRTIDETEYFNQLENEENEKAYAEALAQAARESMAAPKSKVVEHARELVAAQANNYHQHSVEQNLLSGENTVSNDFAYSNANNYLGSNNYTPEQSFTQENSPYNQQDNELFENKAQVGMLMSIVLYLRQLIASFFTHTTLSTFAPYLSRKLGPCYPSTMFLPFLFVGFITGLIGSTCKSLLIFEVPSVLTYLIYLSLTGLAAYRGIYKIASFVNRKRHDSILNAACVIIPMTIFIWLINSFFNLMGGITEATLSFAFICMLSAATASTLSWNLPQDPFDSYGKMTTKGLLFVIVVCFMAAFGLLHYIVGLSVLGVSLVMRLIFGYTITKNNGTAQRSYINALQMVTFFTIILDLILLKSQGYELLSSSTLDLVNALRHYSKLL